MAFITLAGTSTTTVTTSSLHYWRKIATVAMLVLFALQPALAQNPAWRWVAQSTESGAASVQHLTSDALGNAYVTGRFTKQARFGAFTLQSAGSSDVFIAKISAEGKWQWAIAAGGAGADMASGIVVDSEGNVTVAGSFAETAHFGTFTKQSQGGHDVFVATLSAAGEWRTVTAAGGPDQDQITALTLDAQRNVLVGGRFRGTVSFGSHGLSSATDADGFIAKLNPQGQWQWASQTNGDEQTVISSLAVDAAGEVYAAGYFAGATRFGSNKLVSAGTHDAFVAKIGKTGRWQWATAGGGTSTDYAKGITVSRDGNVFVTGSFSGRATFGATAFVSQGGDDAYVARLSAKGEWQWVHTIAGNALEEGADVCLGAGNSIYVTGRFSRGAQYGTTNLTSTGSTDVFVARLSQAGEWMDFLSAGSTATDEASVIKANPNGAVYVGGIVGAATSFGAKAVGETSPQVFVGRVEFPARVTADVR